MQGTVTGHVHIWHPSSFLFQQSPNTEGPLKPVMVWFHGGGFVQGSGSSDIYGPEYLVAEDVILVTLNYRLGPFGNYV
jgi:carboxylesterase type B